MTRVFDPQGEHARYARLGLVANPFFGVQASPNEGVRCEMTSAANQLLRAIVTAAGEEKPRPIWVTKDNDIPSRYAQFAESRVQQTVGLDDELNLTYGAIPLFGMKDGAVRAVLRLFGERLVWRRFDRTLAAYVGNVLAEPDESLPSYQVMGPDALAAFSDAYAADPIAAVCAVLGDPERERMEEAGGITDMRQVDFVGDGADTAEADGDEIDETVGDAPGLAFAVASSKTEESEDDPYAGVADYLIDYTREHLSPAVGRVLRVYRERGLVATTAELNITRAPRKTLAAFVKLARAHYSKVVIMFDGFEHWLDIEPELRSKILGLLSELRWSLDGDAVVVFLVGQDQAPDLEETFGSSTRLTWDFPGLIPIEEAAPDAILPDLVNCWLASATDEGRTPLTLADPMMSELVDAANGSMARLVHLGQEAIEDAADRQVESIDEAAVKAAIAAVIQDEAEAAASGSE